MNILIVTGIFPPDHGGPASYVPRIAAALSKNHNILGVITLSDILDVNFDAGYPVFRIHRRRNRIIRRFKCIWLIYKMSKNADIVYVNGLVFESIIAAKILRNCRVAVKIVGDFVWETARNRKSTLLSLDDFQSSSLSILWKSIRLFYTFCLKKADCIITPSCYLKTIVTGWGIQEHKVEVILNSVDIANDEKEIIEKKYDLITVARLVSWKGIDRLIDIAKRNNWSLLIVGDGPLREELEIQAGDFLNKGIDFTGHVSHADVSNHLRSAKLFILNSTYEGLPHIVLEAMNANIPVIATDVGGTSETIINEVDGYLVKYGDDSAIEKIAKQLLHDIKLRDSISLRARKKIKEIFCFSKMLLSTLKIFNEMVIRK